MNIDPIMYSYNNTKNYKIQIQEIYTLLKIYNNGREKLNILNFGKWFDHENNTPMNSKRCVID